MTAPTTTPAAMTPAAMTPERWRRLDEVLSRAVELEGAERQAFLDDACGDDADLRREVEELLALEGRADGFLDKPLASLSPAASPPRLEAGHRIGPYEVVRRLGEGGMGEVYLAARVDDFEKRVALKLLRPEGGTGELLVRFRVERQIQARLEHPHISRLLDGGTAEDGRPFFAMEYVDGEPIDLWCDRHRGNPRACLELFLKVCAAVHFAHQHLVVHRDLKPSNILVTQDGEPKLLDFGIAKILGPDSAVTRIETRPGSSPMTLHYASPEQMREEPVSTTSDVYSLGVLLYRSLSGRLPGEIESVSIAEVVRRICDEDPQPPSAVAPQWLRRRLRGDLDAIVLKALRKDPRRRYGSVEKLAEDLRRFLDGRPVEARRGTFFYRTGKLVRRHRWPAASLAALVIASIGMGLWEWRRLDAERERAEKVTVFLEGLFTPADPDARQGEALEVRDVLAHGREELEALAGEPELYAVLAGTLGRIHHRLGNFQEARELLAISLESWRRDHPSPSPELARRLGNLGAIAYETGDYVAAAELLDAALDVRRRLGQEGPELVKALNNLAAVVALSGDYARAEDLYREGLRIRTEWNVDDSGAVATSHRHLGWVLYRQGELAEAEEHLARALELRRAELGERHTGVASVLHVLGNVRRAAGDRDGAERTFTEALRIRRQLLGEDHVAVARTRLQLAALLMDGGESPETVAVLLDRALEVLYRVKPADDWEVADAESLLGAHLAASGRREVAEPCLSRSAELLEERYGTLPEAREARERFDAFR